jgi:hypothetical protein
MVEFFTAGGMGMYPTLVFGFLMVASGVLYWLRGEARYLAVTASLGLTTLGAGLLGSCMGVVMSFRYLHLVPAPDRLVAAALGVSESLHDVVLALSLVVIAGVIASAGALRSRAAVGLDPQPG